MTRFISFLYLLTLGILCLVSQAQEKKDPISDSINWYVKKGKYKMAEPFARQLTLKIKNEDGAESEKYLKAITTHADLLRQAGRQKEALAAFLEVLPLAQKTKGDNHPEVANIYKNIGQVYLDLGQYPEADSILLKAVSIQKDIEPEKNTELASSYSSLGVLYTRTGDFEKSEFYNLKALDIRKLTFDNQHLQLGISYNNLGVMYLSQGNFLKAEPFFKSALQIRVHNFGELHPEVGSSKINLGIIYQNLGDYKKALHYYLEGTDIFKNTLGESHPNLANAYHNLAVVYKYLSDISQAEKYEVEALRIRKLNQKVDNPGDALFYINLVDIHREMGLLHKAENDGLEALRIRQLFLDPHSFELGLNYHVLGSVYILKADFVKAEANLLKSKQILEKALGADHPYLVSVHNTLGDLYRNMNMDDKAESAYKLAFVILLKEIQSYFPSLSDAEKSSFYASLETDIASLPTFAPQRIKSNPAITGEVYNNILATKALLLNTTARWKQRIKLSGDKKLLNLFNRWEDTQAQIASLYMETDSSSRSGIDSLLQKSENMEKELSIRSEAYGKMSDKKLTTWKEVQAILKPGDVAIEMIRFNKFGILRTQTDSSDPKKPVYTYKGLTDSVWYAALIVKPGLKHPKMVLLENGDELETKFANYYKNCIQNQVPDTRSYNRFWKKISDNLGKDARRIYFSPEGIYHSINLNTLFNTQKGKYLLEEKDIRFVTVTKDLLAPKREEEMNKLAYLFGFPNYNTSITDRQKLASVQRNSPDPFLAQSLIRSNAVFELPGTKREVEDISLILNQNGWNVETFTGDKALEETLKESYKPRVLHLATHGFFKSDTANNNPLLRSGLLLTGANHTLAGEKTEKTEDGILTAYEAMNLNLDNTDLVVLSACETGLGDIKSGEGVYGLQRAFKVAGAKSIIMSLWKVSDAATQELMVSFYKNWLSKPQHSGSLKLSGSLKRQAFLQAQKELKVKYPNPYHWGAFVMVGE